MNGFSVRRRCWGQSPSRDRKVFLVAFLAFGCVTVSKPVTDRDPTSLFADGHRDPGTGGRTQVLRNSAFVQGSPRLERSISIPVNPICLRSGAEKGSKSEISARGGLVAALYPADRRQWSSPIVIDSIILDDAIAGHGENMLKLDAASLPDGRYHILLCGPGARCVLPKQAFGDEVSDGLGINLRNTANGKIRFLDRAGIFGSEKFRKFLASVFDSNSDVIGIGTNIWIEQGMLVWPREPATFWNGRMIPFTSPKDAVRFTDDKAYAPVLHLSFGPAVKGLYPGFCLPELEVIAVDLRFTGSRLSLPSAGISMDTGSDRQDVRISWPNSSGTGFLVWDRNHDGAFQGISELIAVGTIPDADEEAESAFDVLKRFDDQNDRILDSHDGEFKHLGVWQDSNSDGKIAVGEIQTLAELGIESISLTIVTIPESDGSGNYSLFRSTAKNGKKKHFLIYGLRLRISPAAGNIGVGDQPVLPGGAESLPAAR